jgi:hypothetical protein
MLLVTDLHTYHVITSVNMLEYRNLDVHRKDTTRMKGRGLFSLGDAE